MLNSNRTYTIHWTLEQRGIETMTGFYLLFYNWTIVISYSWYNSCVSCSLSTKSFFRILQSIFYFTTCIRNGCLLSGAAFYGFIVAVSILFVLFPKCCTAGDITWTLISFWHSCNRGMRHVGVVSWLTLFWLLKRKHFMMSRMVLALLLFLIQ